MKSEVACRGNDYLRLNQIWPLWRIECGGKSEWCNQTSGIIYIHSFSMCNAGLLNISKYAKELLFLESQCLTLCPVSRKCLLTEPGFRFLPIRELPFPRRLPGKSFWPVLSWLNLWLGFLRKQKNWGGLTPPLGLRGAQVPLPPRLGELGTNHNASESLLSPLAQSMHLNI